MEGDKFVLLIDDEKDFLETITFWLSNRGYKVMTCYSGKEALEFLAKQKPYLIFLDINMPDMNGIDVLKKIREKDKKTPVIMLTAASTKERIEKTQDLGISGFFPKNESLEDLAKLLEVTLRIHGRTL